MRDTLAAKPPTRVLRAETASRHGESASPADDDEAERLLMEHESQEIRVGALVLAVLAFFLFIAAEIVPKERYVVLTLVALGTLGFAWIGPLTLLAGSKRSPKFKWWQPFQGGTEFVWMQAFGWSLHTLVLTGAAVMLANTNRMDEHGKWMEGQYLVLGLTGFVAQLLLNLSIGVFNEAFVVENEHDDHLGTKPISWNAKAIVSMAISASGAILFVFFDLYGSRLQSTVVILAGCAEFVLSALMIHVFYGCKEIPGYRAWMPFEGERVFLLLQYLGWQFFALTIVGTMMLCVAIDFNSSPPVYRGAPTAVGAAGLISQIVLLMSLQHFRTPPTNKTRHPNIENKTRTTHKWPPEVFVSGLLCLATLGVGVVSYISRLGESTFLDDWRSFYLTHEKIFWCTSIMALSIASPIAHLGAVRAVPDYSWWQPFLGGTKYVFLQTLGWLWYGFFVASSLLLVLNNAKFAETVVPFTLLLGCASSMAIAWSIKYFEPEQPTPPFRRSPLVTSIAPGIVAGLALKRAKNRQEALQRGEITISLMMTMSSILCHLVADYFRNEHDEQTPYEACLRYLSLGVGSALFALGCFVAHASGKRTFDGYRIWQPFEGSPQFVVRQAIGWTLFAVQLLFETLIISVPAQSLPRGVVSVIGFIGMIPHVVIVSSIRYFRPTGGSTRRTKTYPLTPTVSPRLHASKKKTWKTLIHRPDLFSLLAVDAFVTIGTMMLFLGAHLCHQSKRFRHADEVLYGFGSVLSVGAIVFTHVGLGPRVQPGYRYFQPFQGGLKFITFQGVAWTLASVAWVAASTALYWRHVYFQFRAIHMLTGLVFFIAQAILLHSLPYFQPTKSSSKSSCPELLRIHLLNLERFTHEYFVGPLLGMAACAAFVLVDFSVVYWGPSLPVLPVLISAVVGLLSAVPMSYKFAKSAMRAEAKTLRSGVVYLVLGSALWSFTILLGALYCIRIWGMEGRAASHSVAVDSLAPVVSSPASLSTNFMGTFTGTVGFFAQLVFFQASESKCDRSSRSGSPRPHGSARAAARRAKEHLIATSVWLYSSVGVGTGLVCAYASTIKASRQQSPHQTLWVTVCSLGVLCCACWIQRQILHSGSPVNVSSRSSHRDRDGPCFQLSDSTLVQLESNAFAHIAAFLTAAELMRVSTSCRSFQRLHDETFWRRQFVERFASNSGTVASIPLICDSDQLHVVAPFASEWMAFFENRLLNAVCRLDLAALTCPELDYPSQPTVRQHKWRAITVSKEDNAQCEQCQICGRLEILNDECYDWEHRQKCSLRVPTTWIRLCNCTNPVTFTPKSAHRLCLEQLQLGDLSPCCHCHGLPQRSERYPQTLTELCRVTWSDFRSGREDFAGGFFSFVPMAVTLVVLSARSFQFGCLTLYVWVCFAMALCFVSNTPRVSQSFERIGVDESSRSYVAYQRLIHALTFPSMAHVLWCLATSPLGVLDVFLGINFGLLSALASALLLLYWRTSYRVSTYASCPPQDENKSVGLSATTGITDHPNTTTTVGTEGDAIDQSCIACVLELCTADQPAIFD